MSPITQARDQARSDTTAWSDPEGRAAFDFAPETGAHVAQTIDPVGEGARTIVLTVDAEAPAAGPSGGMSILDGGLDTDWVVPSRTRRFGREPSSAAAPAAADDARAAEALTSLPADVRRRGATSAGSAARSWTDADPFSPDRMRAKGTDRSRDVAVRSNDVAVRSNEAVVRLRDVAEPEFASALGRPDGAQARASRTAAAVVDRPVRPRPSSGSASDDRRTGVAGGVAGRRTVRIGGTATAPGVPRLVEVERRRPTRSSAERLSDRPDRIALWAVLLGVFLIVVAALS